MSVSSTLTDSIVGLKTILNAANVTIVSPHTLNEDDVITENSDGSITFTKATLNSNEKLHMYFHSTSSSLDKSVSTADETFNMYDNLKYSFKRGCKHYKKNYYINEKIYCLKCKYTHFS